MRLDWIRYDPVVGVFISAICCEFVSAWERKKQIASAASGQGKQQGSVHASIVESSDLIFHRRRRGPASQRSWLHMGRPYSQTSMRAFLQNLHHHVSASLRADGESDSRAILGPRRRWRERRRALRRRAPAAAVAHRGHSRGCVSLRAGSQGSEEAESGQAGPIRGHGGAPQKEEAGASGGDSARYLFA
jgi:hypothetical protein